MTITVITRILYNRFECIGRKNYCFRLSIAMENVIFTAALIPRKAGTALLDNILDQAEIDTNTNTILLSKISKYYNNISSTQIQFLFDG